MGIGGGMTLLAPYQNSAWTISPASPLQCSHDYLVYLPVVENLFRQVSLSLTLSNALLFPFLHNGSAIFILTILTIIVISSGRSASHSYSRKEKHSPTRRQGRLHGREREEATEVPTY